MTTAFCHQCKRITETVYLPLRGGLIGNLCAICRACRKGKPFISRREYESTLMPTGAEGEGHAKRTIPV